MHHNSSTKRMAIMATLHCLLGCSIGEIIGMILGTWLALSNIWTVAVSTVLAFVFGYSLSAWSLHGRGMSLKKVLLLVLAADSLSILTMEIADNLVMVAIPGAMNAGLGNALFWTTMPLSLIVAFMVAVPVNYVLLLRGRGHALTHQHHHMH